MSGILLGKTMGRSDELADRFERESERLADLEVRSRMAGRWMMASIQTSFAVMPALVYLFAGLDARRGHDRHPGRLHDAADAAVLADPVAAQRRRRHPDLDGAVRARVRVPRPAGRPARGRRDAARPRARRRALRGRVVPLRRRAGRCAASTSTCRPGRKLALVGETGSGKTTLGYLAARLYDPEQGSVRLDGDDLRELRFGSLADAVGVVSQETYLFHASVRENLRFAQPEATDEEIEEAARAAQIHDTIAALPDGYDTVVGERGFRFSGGERQRIAIARTILRNPPVLVLDEATSALDVQTERAVGEALERLAEGRTTIVIAHRLSTVRDADQIVVLDGGARRRARHARGAARRRRPLRRARGARRRRGAVRLTNSYVRRDGLCQAPDFLRWLCEAPSVRRYSSLRCSRSSSRSAVPPRRRSCSARATSTAGWSRTARSRRATSAAARCASCARRRTARSPRRSSPTARSRPGKLAAGAVGTARARRAARSAARRSPTARSPPPTSAASGGASARRSARSRSASAGRASRPGLPAELAGADISNDLVLVPPDDRWVERRLTFTVRAVVDPRPLRAVGLQRRATSRHDRGRVRGRVPLRDHRPALDDRP